MRHGKGKKGLLRDGVTAETRHGTLSLRGVRTSSSKKKSTSSSISDVSQGNDNWFSCPCGGKAYWDPEIAIGNYVIGGWKCPDCGEEMYEPVGAEMILTHNKLRKKGYDLKLNKVRSNLILRIPVEVSYVLGLDNGDTVDLRLNERDEIVVKTGKRPLSMLRRKKQ